MSRNVKVDELSVAINEELNGYSADLQHGIRKITDKAAIKLKKLIQEGAPVNKRKTKRRGTYKKSWKVKTVEDTTLTYEKVVYSPKEYSLTHLLEKGHKVPHGSKRIEARPHIKPAADRIEGEYIKDIERLVKNPQSYGGRGSIRKSYKK